MKCWTALILWFAPGQLWVRNGSEITGKMDLIKSDFLRPHILNMANTTIGEDVPLEFEFSEHFLKFSKYQFHHFWFP